MDKAYKILKDVFGYDSFRSLQKEIIGNVLDKKDTVVIMPTGGGKSLCYQVPALIFNGLTIVISPLISLMKDQVEQLRQLGVTTALLNSSLTQDVYRQNFESVKNGKAKLLYLAPESLGKEDISNLIKTVKLDCITIDEAHCISEWGHDFRKDYRQLGIFRKAFPNAVCIALTATATPRVQDDIANNLNLIEHKKYVASFNRENLFLEVIPKQNSYQQVVDFINEHKNQSGIIYCFSRKQVDSLHDYLSSIGYSTKPYHAGLSDDERSLNQELFIKDEVQIIIATIAFGMGINKSNVRFVLHHDLPKNIESYYQEIGRGGRDGLKSDCLLLFSYSDIVKIKYFIDQKEDEAERRSAQVHLNAMIKYAESESCRRHPLINYFGEHYKTENCAMCDNCLGDEKESSDITIAAQKFMSAVKRTGEIFGINYIVDVLTGSESDKIFSNAHQNLTVYGVGKEFNKKQWQLIARQLVSKEYLNNDNEYGSLKLTEKSYGVLLRNEKVFGFIKEPEVKIKSAKKAAAGIDQPHDEKLFELLKAKRKELADKAGVPPYVIFSDKTLIEMCITYPVNTAGFLHISGVGQRKFESYGETFISIIKKYVSQNNIPINETRPRAKVNSIASTKPKYMIVSEFYNEGKPIDKLAKEFGVQERTIIQHLFKYANEGNTIRTNELIERINLSEKYHQKVFDAFEKNGVFPLRTIFDLFEGSVSYDDLQLLKLVYINKDFQSG